MRVFSAPYADIGVNVSINNAIRLFGKIIFEVFHFPTYSVCDHGV